MNEKKWVSLVIKEISPMMEEVDSSIRIQQGVKLPYAYEIRSYSKQPVSNYLSYETDMLISESFPDGSWKPRVVVEAKINSVTTHDAITYSEKAIKHKHVHPYLRYGIMLGNRKHYPLPGRLYRNGAYFDFMLSWVKYEPSEKELDDMVNVLLAEVQASRHLEEILYTSREKGRQHYTVLHKPLILK